MCDRSGQLRLSADPHHVRPGQRRSDQQGVGNGWLKNVGAANTDLVFGVIAEEMG